MWPDRGKGRAVDTPAAALLEAFTLYGGNPHALVSLGPGASAWCADARSGVSYVARGAFWLAAGDPIAPHPDVARVARAFAAVAAARGKHPVFLPATEAFAQRMRGEGWTCLKLGASPYFDLTTWHPRGDKAARLRSGVNQGTRAGVVVDQSTDVHTVRAAVDRLCAAWLETRPAGATFGWLFALDPLRHADLKRFALARDANGEIVGLLAASPIPLLDGWYLEDVVRAPHAPAGTADLLVFKTLRLLQSQGYKTATLGTALLADEGSDATPLGDWPRTQANLKVAKSLLGGFYNFEGVRSFKAKFVPTRWEGEYAVMPEAGHALRPIRIGTAALRAVMPGGIWPLVRGLVRRT